MPCYSLDWIDSHLKAVKQGVMWIPLKENTQRKCVARGTMHPELASASEEHKCTYPPARIVKGVPHTGRAEEADTHLSLNAPLSGLGGSQQGRRIPVSHRNADHVVTPLCYLRRTFWHKNVQSFLPRIRA